MSGGNVLVLISAFFIQYWRSARIFHQPAVLAMAVVALAGGPQTNSPSATRS